MDSSCYRLVVYGERLCGIGPGNTESFPKGGYAEQGGTDIRSRSVIPGSGIRTCARLESHENVVVLPAVPGWRNW